MKYVPAVLADARTAWWMRGCASVGADLRLYGRPSVDAYGGTIRIGSRCRLVSTPTVSHFVAGEGAVLDIGDEVYCGHGAAIAAFERVEIGAGTSVGPFVIIMDTNFHRASGDQSVEHDCRPVIIGRHCQIGSRVTITRGVTIGDGARILSGSVVSSSIPANACAAGGRARVIGPAGGSGARWDAPAVMVPLLLQEALQLAATPDSAAALGELPHWGLAHAERVRTAIGDLFGLVIERRSVEESATVSDLIDAVERVRQAARPLGAS